MQTHSMTSFIQIKFIHNCIYIQHAEFTATFNYFTIVFTADLLAHSLTQLNSWQNIYKNKTKNTRDIKR